MGIRITLDRDLEHLRDSLIPKYGELVYNGFWYAPEREALQAFFDKSQEAVTGTVRLKLYKGNVHHGRAENPRSPSTKRPWAFDGGGVPKRLQPR